MVTDNVNVHRIYSETLHRLERYSRLVSEGRALEPALDFARYVFWSGICKLCEEHAQPAPLKIDGSFLRWKCEELQRAVQDRYSSNDMAPHLGEAELATVHDKLDKIAGYLSKLSSAPAVVVNGNGERAALDESLQVSRFEVPSHTWLNKRDGAEPNNDVGEAGEITPHAVTADALQ